MERKMKILKAISMLLAFIFILPTALFSCSGKTESDTQVAVSTSPTIESVRLSESGEVLFNVASDTPPSLCISSSLGEKTLDGVEQNGGYAFSYTPDLSSKKELSVLTYAEPFIISDGIRLSGESVGYTIYSLASRVSGEVSENIILLVSDGTLQIGGKSVGVTYDGFEYIEYTEEEAPLYAISSSLDVTPQTEVGQSFNHFTVSYSSDTPLKGRLVYKDSSEVSKCEEYYLASGQGMTFSSFIEDDGAYIESLAFEALTSSICHFSLTSLDLEAKERKAGKLTLSNDLLSAEFDLDRGGELISLTDPSNTKYSSLLSSSQTVLYGTRSAPYTGTEYSNSPTGRIIDVSVMPSALSVTYRPLDSGKESGYCDQYITTTYTLEKKYLSVSVSVFDFYEYGHECLAAQKLPCVAFNAALCDISYANTESPWTNASLTKQALSDSGVKLMYSSENTERFAMLTDSDGYGFGIYSPDCEYIEAEISSLSLCRKTYLPYKSTLEYSYAVAAGESAQVRQIFKSIYEGVSEDIQTSYTVNGTYIVTNDGEKAPLYNNYLQGPLTGTDDVGRVLPDSSATKTVRQDRYVGLFYFLWLGEHGDNGIFDNTKIVAEHSDASSNEDVWGDVNDMHFFTEPLYGYYKSSDEWVMRKHAEMLTNANVDFLYLDVTNGYPYLSNSMKLMKVLDELIKQGWDAPKVVFYTNTNTQSVVSQLYSNIYSTDYCPDVWFKIDGKPVIVADSSALSSTYTDFFTIREPQWPNEATKKTNAWPWMSFFYDSWGGEIFYNSKGEAEAVSVSVAQHCGSVLMSRPAMYSSYYGDTGDRGRSYHNGKADSSTDAYLYGYNFQERWDEAIKADVPYVLVTSWNEWVAQRQESGTYTTGWGPFKRTHTEIKFVDTFNLEYSRDIEPARGYYFDNYYMQLIYNIRRYKGVSPTLHQTKRPTGFITGFDSWDKVQVTYRDISCDNADRAGAGFGSTTITNTTGRNDIVEAKVCFDDERVYFLVRCKESIKPYEDGSTWMRLYIDSDNTSSSGWYGYDYIVNFSSPTGTTLKTAKFTGTGKTDYAFTENGECEYWINGSEMMISVPHSLLGTDPETMEFSFKWADSSSDITTIEQFYTDGDAAPLGRLNYYFVD